MGAGGWVKDTEEFQGGFLCGSMTTTWAFHHRL